jgi:hypothetical protein
LLFVLLNFLSQSTLSLSYSFEIYLLSAQMLPGALLVANSYHDWLPALLRRRGRAYARSLATMMADC